MNTILVVEDDQFHASLCKQKLEKAGFTVLIARDGEEGLALLKTHTPDLVLLDLILPKMPGFAVLEIAKADQNLRKIPVIVLTNLSGVEVSAKAQMLGADLFLIKTDVTPDQIVKSIEEVLAKHADKQ